MKAGAFDFLTKPFREQDMLDTVAKALERDRIRRSEDKYNSRLRERFESLTARERQIMAMVTAGLLNKQVADKVGISEVTVKMHRGHVMQKMGTRSLADLVFYAEKLGIRGREMND
jgi:FixJ family two-component response regulator